MTPHRPASLLATWFGAGLVPGMPGTWGALAALPFAAILQYWTGSLGLGAATVLVFLVGIWACNGHIAHLQVDDPPSAVIDEVAGQWLTLLAAPLNIWAYLTGFILFRLFDIMKPWPIAWLDGHVAGGFGTMIDDMVAGLYAALILLLLGAVVGGPYALF